jgi:hypothetical protein
MEKCTWKECDNNAETPQLDKNGKQWANFCSEHNKMLNDAIDKEPFNPKKMLQCWVKASGGASKMSEELCQKLN